MSKLYIYKQVTSMCFTKVPNFGSSNTIHLHMELLHDVLTYFPAARRPSEEVVSQHCLVKVGTLMLLEN